MLFNHETINKITFLKAKPTEDGSKCKQNDLENVCKQVIAINFQYQCETEFGYQQKCSDGKFLVAETRSEPYTSTFTLKDSIKLSSLGFYDFEFYTLFNSPSSTVNDSLSIEVKYDKNLSFESIFFTNNRFKETKWRKEIVQFQPKSRSFQVNFDFILKFD